MVIDIEKSVEPGKISFRTEPNRTDELSKSPEPKRIEPNRLLPVVATIATSCSSREPVGHITITITITTTVTITITITRQPAG